MSVPRPVPPDTLPDVRRITTTDRELLNTSPSCHSGAVGEMACSAVQFLDRLHNAPLAGLVLNDA